MAAPAARILVIEDNALLRAQLQRLFADAGMAVEFASDGLAGLQMALDAPPDVLVLDVGLPGLDGLRLCERLRTHADRHVLAEAWPRTLTRSELIQRLWGDAPPDSDPLRTHLYLLRQALDKPFATPMLKTVHGVGFRLQADA